jgi:hypothetical protein
VSDEDGYQWGAHGTDTSTNLTQNNGTKVITHGHQQVRRTMEIAN